MYADNCGIPLVLGYRWEEAEPDIKYRTPGTCVRWPAELRNMAYETPLKGQPDSERTWNLHAQKRMRLGGGGGHRGRERNRIQYRLAANPGS